MTRGDEALFEVCEVFRSLQGETSRTGLPATFLRLAGCNLRCRYCDTTYAQGRGASMTLEELLGAVADGPATDLVVVTGGAARPSKGAPSSAPNSNVGDRVELSPLSSQLQSIESSMGNAPVVDSARVAEIRQRQASAAVTAKPVALC